MPFLDAPAFDLRFTLDDVLGVVESVLKGRHWRNFDIDSVTLRYVPYWFFNYDIYQEVEGKSETYSSQMAMNGLTGEMQPTIIQILESIPVEKSKEITHGIEHTIEQATISKDEIKNIAQLKVAGEMRIPKSTITISGINMAYVPIWRIWVRLGGGGTRRIDLDALSGSPFHIDTVPERERGTMEVTIDMLQDLKRPEGWIDYSTKAFNWGFGVVKHAGGQAAGAAGQGTGMAQWLLGTKMGRYTALGIIIVVLIALIATQG